MASARFQIFSTAPDFQLVSVIKPSTAEPAGASASDDEPERRASSGQVGWRLLAANNRSLGQSPTLFSDVEECLDGMRLLRRRLPEVEIVTKCSGRPQQWTWHLHYDGAELAVSSRGYQRRIRARYAGVSFSQLALVAYGSPCVVP